MPDIEAHITGTVWKIEVAVGDDVSDGDTVVILESMKMEMPVEAEDDGKVAEIKLRGGPVRLGGRRPRRPRVSEELAGGKLLLDEPADAVARLTLNRPDSRNALDHELLDAIAEAMPSLDRDIEVRCVLLTGTGKAFSAGYDIAAIPAESFERDAESLVAHPFHAALEAVAGHPWPVIAALNGHALGGGLSWH